MKKIIFSVAFFFLSFNYVSAQTHSIFVLDTSKSAILGGYFTSMQQNIKNIASLLHEEDQISLFTFDSEVSKIISKRTISREDLNNTIDEIVAEGNWTYTELVLKEIVEFIQNEYGQSFNLYIFSDGLNDPPPNQSTNFDSYSNANSNIFYFYYLEQEEQKNLIQQAFPDVILQKITKDEAVDDLTAQLDAFIPNIEIEIQEGVRGLLPSGIESTLVVNVIANKALAGKEAVFNITSSKKIFKKNPKKQTRFIIQEGINNFRFPYEIKNNFHGRQAEISFTVSLTESPEKKLSRKNTSIKIAKLPFVERIYKLPLYGIPTFFLIVILLYLLYRGLYYYFFTPVIQISYQLTSKDEDSKINTANINTLDMGVLESGLYSISSQPNAFLVLPELSRYSELILIKKGKKFKTRLLIHSNSLRSLATLEGRKIKRKRIKNGTTFQLDNYIFSFKTNLQ